MIGLALLALLAFALVVLVRRVPAPVQTGQEKVPRVAVAQAPTQDLPPAAVVIGTIYPTETPLPTFTPWPTPTPRPAPTETALPPKPPAKSAMGYLLYSMPNPDNKLLNLWMSVSVDASGQKVQGSEQRWSDLDPSLTYAQPSPTGKYTLFLQPGGVGGVPYIYEPQTKQTRPLFGNEKLYAEYNIDKFDQLFGLPFGWHPDNKRVLFWVGIGGYAGLWLVNVETGERTIVKLIDNAPPQGAIVSPDGQRVAYVISDLGSTHLEIIHTNGSLDKVIPQENVLSLFDWSPDGKWLLFLGSKTSDNLGKSSASSDGSLWLINPDSLEVRPLQIPLVSGRPFKAQWSPDSRYVAAVGLTPGEKFRCSDADLPASEADTCMYQGTSIYIQDITTSVARPLALGILPIWSPDGSMLAFLSNRTGNPEIWTIHADGNQLQQVTSDGQWKWTSLSWVSSEGALK